jgi:NADH-quinone oxidoreductase subunit N
MSWSEVSLIAPMIWLTLGGVATLLVDAFVRREGQGHLLVTSLIFVILALTTLGRGGDGTEVFAGVLVVDAFADFFNLTFLVAALLTLAIGSVYFAREEKPVAEFYPLLLFSTVGMMVMVSAVDLVTLFVGLETMSIALYVLSASQRHSLFSSEAGFKYLILGAFSSAFLLFGMSMLYGSTQTLHLPTMFAKAHAVDGITMPVIFAGGWALVFIGLAFKVALVPFHMWTPDVYEGAPAPVTGFMAAGVKAASFAVLLRVVWTAADAFFNDAAPLIAGFAIATMVFGNIVALAQTNVKRMLAYSAIAHAGYLFVGLAATSSRADDAAAKAMLFYLFSYALMNVGTFALVSLVSRRDGERCDLDGFAGLARRNPLVAATMAVLLLSLAGIPPTAGFWGKFYVFESAVQQGHLNLVIIALLNSAVAMYYYLRVIVVMYMREPQGEAYDGHNPQISAAMAATAVAVLWIGLFPGPLTELARLGASALAASF